jgi:hypothetical protein
MNQDPSPAGVPASPAPCPTVAAGSALEPGFFVFLLPYFFGLTYVAQRLVPLLVTGFFLGIAWCGLGHEYNVPALFWYDSDNLFWHAGQLTFSGFLSQLVSGFSVTLLFGYLWLVTYLVDAREGEKFLDRAATNAQQRRRWNTRLIELVVPRCPKGEVDDYWLGLRWYLSVTWLPLTILLAIPVSFTLFHWVRDEWLLRSSSQAPTDRPVFHQRWPFLIGILLAAVLVRWTVCRLQRLHDRLLREPEQSSRLANLARDKQRWLLALGRMAFGLLALTYLVGFLAYLLGYVWSHVYVWLDWLYSPVVAVCQLSGVLAGISAAIWFHLRRWGWLVLGLVLVLALVCNSWTYKLRFPGLEDEYAAAPLNLEDEEEPVAPEAFAQLSDKDKEVERDELVRLHARLYRQLHPDQQAEFKRLETYDAEYNLYDLLKHEAEDAEQNNLDNWLASLPTDERQTPKLVVVAVSGGANRSALWTAKVLDTLERDPVLGGSGRDPGPSTFPRHIRVITGASGGMVGAAHYVATLNDKGHDQFKQFKPEDVVKDDHLSPIINRLVFREVPFLFLPLPYYTGDRGQALEDALARTTPDLDQTFEQLRSGEEAGWRPSLIFSPMLVEDGRRLLISNRNLPFLAVSEGHLLLHGPSPTDKRPPRDQKAPYPAIEKRAKQLSDPGQDRYSRSAIEFFRLFPEARGRFRLSTAARMNASFPYVSPAVDLPTDPPRRVVDAGYYDNYGVNVAAQWLYHHRAWILTHKAQVVLIQVRDSLSQDQRLNLLTGEARRMGSLRERWNTSTEWLTGPPAGAASARQSVMSFRNDEQLQVLSFLFNQRPEENAGDPQASFTTVIFELPCEVGMNWYLTEEDKRQILGGIDNAVNVPALKMLENWWMKPF